MITAMVPPLLRRPTLPGLQEEGQGRSISFSHGLRTATNGHAVFQPTLDSPISLSVPRSFPLEHSVSAPGQVSSGTPLTATRSTSSTMSTSTTSSNVSPGSAYASVPATPSSFAYLRPPASGSSLYQISISMIARLSSIPGIGVYLMHARIPSPTDTPAMLFSASYLDAAITPSATPASELVQLAPVHVKDQINNDIDPVTQLWRLLRQGTSLCVIFNALNSGLPGYGTMSHSNLIVPNVETTPPSQQEVKICKRGVYEFVQACKSRLGFTDENLFTIMNVFSDDTTDLLKVTRTVNLVLDAYDALVRSDDDRSSTNLYQEALGLDSAPSDLRSKVVQELLQTERRYVQDLELLQDYMQQLQTHEVLSTNSIHVLFPNLNALVDFQRKFLVGVETNARVSAGSQRFGALFSRMEHGFSVYETYASQQKQAADLAVQEGPKLARFGHLIEPTYELPSILIKPIQRICRYPLLLKELLKYTPEEEEYYNELLDGFHAMKRVTDRINETQRQVENRQTVLSLVERIEDWKGHKTEQFGSLLFDGNFMCVEDDKDYHYYLFENILLFCKEENTASNGRSLSNGGYGSGSSLLALNTPSISGLSSVSSTHSSKKKKNILQSTVAKKASLSMFSSSENSASGSLTLDGRIYTDNIINVSSATTKTSGSELSFNNDYVLTIYWRPDSISESRQYSIRFHNEEILRQWESSIRRLLSIRGAYADQASPFMPHHRQNGLSQTSIRSNISATFPLPPPLVLPNKSKRSTSSTSSSNSSSPGSHLSVIERLLSTSSVSSQLYMQRTQSKQLKVKLLFQNDCYIILLPPKATFDEMAQKVEKKLKLCNATMFDDLATSINRKSNSANGLRYKMKYRDEDGDLVLLEDEDDWEVAADSGLEDNVVEIFVS
ncbi:hypothetical protein V1512DRAFT_218645 [Lipomyces arxii]|uniref:uncharacterized protein n=1 Tax=Lipomyces arxii TaxID=56418 RepID=UPI0034CFBC73